MLFIICINDLVIASDLFNFITYADETTIPIYLNNFRRSGNLNSNVNQELVKISDWLKVNKLSKCQQN